MKIGERIRRARRHAKLSQIQLSAVLKVQRSAVSNWESANNIYPTMANLVAIACTCDVCLEWLGTGRGPMLLNGEDLTHIPAAHAELVDAENERELLALFRSLPRRSQDLILDLFGALIASKEGKRGKRTPLSRTTF